MQLVSMRLLVRCFRCLCLVILVPAQPAGKPRCPGALGPAGRGRRASGTACHEEGCLGMLPLLDVQRPWAGTESGGTPDSAQFIICGTVIPPPPSSREVQSRWRGGRGFTPRGRQLFRPQGRSARVQALISGWLPPPAGPRGGDGGVGVSWTSLQEAQVSPSSQVPERGSAVGRGIPSSTSLVRGLGGVLCRVVVLRVRSDG